MPLMVFICNLKCFNNNGMEYSLSAKASRRIYLLKQLKRAGIDRKSLIQFYCATIRSVLEYACQAFHSSLLAYLSDQIERVQKRVLRILFPEVSYSKALDEEL